MSSGEKWRYEDVSLIEFAAMLRVICLIAAFHSVTPIPFNSGNYQVQNFEHETFQVKPVESVLHNPTSTIAYNKDDLEGSNPLLNRHRKYRRRRRCKNRPMCPHIVTMVKQQFPQDSNINNSDNYTSSNVRNSKEIITVREHIISDSSPRESNIRKQFRTTNTVNNGSNASNQREKIQKINRTSELIYKKQNISSEYMPERRISSEESTINNESIPFNSTTFGEINLYDDFEDTETYPFWNKSDYLSPISMSFDYYVPFHGGLSILLTRLFQSLGNVSMEDSRHILTELNFIANADEDPCQKWLDSRDTFKQAFLGSLAGLPACPCQYPSNIFYDDKIWDRKQQKHFRWRDVSGESQRLDIYKPGAAYCVQSLLAQGSRGIAAQHCCYDGKRKLLTRGSGAGTPYFISPEISVILHERIDMLPWRLCKGDFSRFNKVRPPNNVNGCETNPDDEEYQRQIDNTKYY